MRILCRCLLTLVAVWAVAASLIHVVQSSQPTPQKLVAYVAEHPLTGLSASKRAAVIDRVARQINGLTLDQRQELKRSGTIRTFYAQLDPDERRRFLALTVPEGFRQLIATLNKMDPVQRKRLAQKTLNNVRRHNAEAIELGREDEITKMMSQGLAMFNEEANAQVKADFARVIEELQRKQEAVKTEATTQ